MLAHSHLCLKWAFAPALLLSLGPLHAQVSGGRPAKKAILIGINCYDPRYGNCSKLKAAPVTSRVKREGTSTGDWLYWSYPNLQGALNDVETMKSILEAHDFVIPADAVLRDEQATADAILATLRKYLIEDKDAQDGDLRVVYYSGHGNYVRNTAVADAREFDESMVPSDHWRGTPDIRDKELSRIFAEAGKKVKVVFIADSCHSGSLSRGPAGRAKTATSGSADDPQAPKVNDKPSAVDPMKAKYGMVLVSAARRDQPALETGGASDDPNDPAHGAFTLALTQALDGNGYAAIDTIFQRAAALLAIDKPAQTPNLEGLNRTGIDLFGEAADGTATQRVVVQTVSDDGVEVRLRGGAAIGVYKDTELRRVGNGPNPVRVKVTQEEGLAYTRAEVIDRGSGSPALKAGDWFEVDKWVAHSGAMLSLYIPPVASGDAIRASMAEFAGLKSDLGQGWVEDETAIIPTHTLSWNGKSWGLAKYFDEGRETDLGASPSAAEIRKALPAGAKLLVVLPPSAELVDALPFSTAGARRVKLLNSPADANYRLRGRASDGLEYAWIEPGVNVDAVRSKQNTMPLPARSDWTPMPDPASSKTAAAALADKAYRLGRLREWQALSPAGHASTGFPYHLAVREVETDRYVKAGDVTAGNYKLYLQAETKDLKALGKPVVSRYVYIFAIDQQGRGTLLWPAEGRGNQDNVFPVPVAEGEPLKPSPESIAVSGDQDFDFEVGRPYGTDTYFLLASLEKIDNPDNVFTFDGVVTMRSGTRGSGENPLSDLLSGIGTLSRAAVSRVPTDWSIERIFLHSKAAEK